MSSNYYIGIVIAILAIILLFILAYFNKLKPVVAIVFVLIPLIVAFVLVISSLDTSSPAPSQSQKYKKCELCDDRKATKGDYCSKCYNTLKGFQNTWGWLGGIF